MGSGASALKYVSRYVGPGNYTVCSEDVEDDGKAPSSSATGRWLWEESPDVWQAYDATINEKLLVAREFGEPRLVFTLNGGVYEVNFEAGTQTHWQTGTERRIRYKGASSGTSQAPPPASTAGSSSASKAAGKQVPPAGEWQWEGPSGWQPFDKEVAAMLIAARLYGKSRVVYALGGDLCEANLDGRLQINMRSERRCRLQWVPVLQFQWEMKNGCWTDFDDEENDALAAAKLAGKTQFEYSASGMKYHVDFARMVQENVDLTVTLNRAWKRKIRICGADVFSDAQAPGGMGAHDGSPSGVPSPQPRRQRSWSAGIQKGLHEAFSRARPSRQQREPSPPGKRDRQSSPRSRGEPPISGTQSDGHQPHSPPPPGVAERPSRNASGSGERQAEPRGGREEDRRSARDGREGHDGRRSSSNRREAPSRGAAPAGPQQERRGSEKRSGRSESPSPSPRKDPSAAAGERASWRVPGARKAHHAWGPQQQGPGPAPGAGPEMGGGSRKPPRYPSSEPPPPPRSDRQGNGPEPGRGGPGPSAPPPRSGGSKDRGGAASANGEDGLPPLPRKVEWPRTGPAKEAAKKIFEEFNGLRATPVADRRKAHRAACLRWHPDKNPDEEDLATEVFQFVQAVKDWFLAD